MAHLFRLKPFPADRFGLGGIGRISAAPSQKIMSNGCKVTEKVLTLQL